MMNDTRLGKTLRKWVVIGLMLCAHHTWAKTEKATIEVLPPKFDEIRGNNRADQALKVRKLQKRLKEKYANTKSAEIMAKMMLPSEVIGRIVPYPKIKHATYFMRCEFFFFLTEAPTVKVDCDLVNSRTKDHVYTTGARVYPRGLTYDQISDNRSELHDDFMEQSLDSIAQQIWWEALNKLPKTAEMNSFIAENLEDYNKGKKRLDYEGGKIADGIKTGKVSLYFENKQTHLPPLREFELTAKYGHFIAGNNKHYPIQGEQQSVKLIPRDTKEVHTFTKYDGSTYRKLRNKKLEFTYRTFNCDETGERVEPPKEATAYEKKYFWWYKEIFTVKLTSKLSRKQNKELLKKEVFFKCPKHYFTANITHTTKKRILDAPRHYGLGDSRNSPYMVNRITTLKSKQVMHFDFNKKELLSVPIVPFHNITKDNGYFNYDENTCSPKYDRRVTTEKISRYRRMLHYDGHLSKDFKPKTPMRFLIDDKEMQFSLQDLKNGGFTYRKTETKQLNPEIEWWFPIHRYPEQIARANVVMDLDVATVDTLVALGLWPILEPDPCSYSDTMGAIEKMRNGYNNGFFAPRVKETTEYDITVRRASKGEIKLFEKQKKKFYPRIFKKVRRKIVVDEERVKGYLPATFGLLDKEKWTFEETVAFTAGMLSTLENFDQILMAVFRDAGLDKSELNKLNNLTAKQKQALLKRIKKMTEADRREFMQQLSEADEAKRAKMLAPSGE